MASHLDPYGADDPATDSVKADNLLTDHGYRPTSVIVMVIWCSLRVEGPVITGFRVPVQQIEPPVV